MTEQPEGVSISVAAAELGMSERSLKRWLADKKLPPEAAGQNGAGHWLIQLDRVPRHLLEAAHKRSQAHMGSVGARQALAGEAARLREVVAEQRATIDRLLAIIERLSAR